MFTRVGKILLLLVLLALLAGCGTNSLTTSQQGNFSNIPTGKGNQPEQGTDGKPRPLPDGHRENILVANGITYIGSDDGQIYAFDEQSGRILWQSKQSANFLEAFVDGTIISTDQAGNTIYGLNATNGALLWRQATPDIDHVQTANGVVYVDTGNAAHPAYIYALQAHSGTLLWQHAQGPDGLGTVSVINGRVYDAPLAEAPDGSTGPQTITVLDASDGHALWNITIPMQDGIVRDGITEANGVAYIGTNHGSVYAVRPQTGQIIWHVSQSASSFANQDIVQVTPVVSNGIVFAGSVEHVFAYRAADGRQLWEYSVRTNGGPGFGMQPFVDNGVVYFVSGFPFGSLVAVRASDGTLIWQNQQVSVDPSDLILSDGLLVNLVNTLTAWRTSDGSQVWQRTTDNSAGPPGSGRPVIVSDGIIYVGGEDGVLHAFRLSDGSQLWQYKLPELPVQQPPVYTASITFSKTTTYDQAMQIVGDLGLKTLIICRAAWTPEDSRQSYAGSYTLDVTANTNSAPLWLNRLQATPGVTQAQALEGPVSCPAEIITPGQLRFLPENQAGTYLQVSFASGTPYIKAWESLNALGFRLADPCYEQARARGDKPVWRPMGEEGSFAQTSTLLLATTTLNATTWRQQLQSVAGVKNIQILVSGTACNS